MNNQLEVETAAHDVLAQIPGFGSFGNRTAQMHRRFDVLTAQEDIAAVSLQRESRDQHAFHQQVRHLFHQQAVFIGARLHFIGVTQQVTDVHGFVFRHQAPLQTGGETCAAAAFQPGVFHQVDDLVRSQAFNGLFGARIAVFAAVFIQPDRLFVIAQPPGQRVHFGSAYNVFNH
ncbi:hypothetical protein D3C80_1199380 [compost metagenome]